jgi:hypothetical protein
MNSLNKERFRPRFSIRALAILIILVCCYAACSGPTKRDGERDVFVTSLGHVVAVAPLVVSNEEYGFRFDDESTVPVSRRYYFWFFGYVAKLPYVHSCTVDDRSGFKHTPGLALGTLPSRHRSDNTRSGRRLSRECSELLRAWTGVDTDARWRLRVVELTSRRTMANCSGARWAGATVQAKPPRNFTCSGNGSWSRVF